jgi:DNA-binding transcriptional regulator YdaS (Cro superfamily)
MSAQPDPKAELRRAAGVLGGQAAVAAACGFDDRRHVWPWFNTARSVPWEHAAAIELATRAEAAAKNDPGLVVTCDSLRPDLCWVRVHDAAWPGGRPCLMAPVPDATVTVPGPLDEAKAAA